MAATCAKRARREGYPAPSQCGKPAVHVYEFGGGMRLPVCAEHHNDEVSAIKRATARRAAAAKEYTRQRTAHAIAVTLHDQFGIVANGSFARVTLEIEEARKLLDLLSKGANS